MNSNDNAKERVRLHRMINKIEELSDELLDKLKKAPDPLPRDPNIDPELVDRLARFTIAKDSTLEEDVPNIPFLEAGNGKQHKNRKRALTVAAKLIAGAKIVDKATIETEEWGTCHFAAFADPSGAMISTPNRDDNNFGSARWHSRDHIMMFRDCRDGFCKIYVCEIEPLFGLRTIGHHGVKWVDVESVAKYSNIITSQYLLALENNANSG